MGIGTKLNPTPWSFIERQHVFFAATAAPDGRVNVSPKGMRTLRILGEAHIRWLNPSGSGYETAADVRASNRDWMRGVYTEKYRKHGEVSVLSVSDGEALGLFDGFRWSGRA